ncbi:MAG TPA: alpha/beta fold hydrolase [Bryobacteraceae bacterium]
MPLANSNGTKVFWNEAESGDPLVMIMGLGHSHELWYRTWPVMTRKYRTIVYDNRGTGQSDVPPGPYSVAQMAADTAAVMDAAGLERAHVLGISMGGMIAQEFAIAYPHRVQSLVLGCTTCGGQNSVPAAPNVREAFTALATMTPEERAEATVPLLFDASMLRARIDESLAVLGRARATDAGYASQGEGIRAWTGCYDRLPQIKAPTLIVHGETDQLIPPQNAYILHERIAGSRLVMLPHAGHMLPDAFQEAVLEFLATSGPRPARSEAAT